MNDTPIPGPHETLRTPIPDSMDGIRFEIGRLVKYIQEGCKDPLVITTAQKIAELAIGVARSLESKLSRDLIMLKGIHAWCHAQFESVPNPANTEVIKTPARMLRELDFPEEFARAMWEPIRDKMAKAEKKDPKNLILPSTKITGTSAPAACLVLTLAAAVGITPMRICMGGYGGTINYVWGSVFVEDQWRDVDILLPELGEHRNFDCYEHLEIPI